MKVRGAVNRGGYWPETGIFGQTLPPSSIDDLELDADIKFDGVPRVAFTATPYHQESCPTGAGNWWLKAYGSQPDVALPPPTRWTMDAASGSTEDNSLMPRNPERVRAADDGLYRLQASSSGRMIPSTPRGRHD